jgi:hypothetical protein
VLEGVPHGVDGAVAAQLVVPFQELEEVAEHQLVLMWHDVATQDFGALLLQDLPRALAVRLAG